MAGELRLDELLVVRRRFLRHHHRRGVGRSVCKVPSREKCVGFGCIELHSVRPGHIPGHRRCDRMQEMRRRPLWQRRFGNLGLHREVCRGQIRSSRISLVCKL